MWLYIRFGSLFQMQQLHNERQCLQKYLKQKSATSWWIEESADLREIERILVGNRINYAIEDD